MSFWSAIGNIVVSYGVFLVGILFIFFPAKEDKKGKFDRKRLRLLFLFTIFYLILGIAKEYKTNNDSNNLQNSISALSTERLHYMRQLDTLRERENAKIEIITDTLFKELEKIGVKGEVINGSVKFTNNINTKITVMEINGNNVEANNNTFNNIGPQIKN